MVSIASGMVRKKYLSKIWIGYQDISLWCFEKDIRTLIFFQQKFGRNICRDKPTHDGWNTFNTTKSLI